jgi:Rhodopirellula transposase DDE domain
MTWRSTSAMSTLAPLMTPQSSPVKPFASGGTNMVPSSIRRQERFYCYATGGSNSSRQSLFKQDLQALVNEWDLEIRIAHYPPYTSKYNPIEPRLFPHLTCVCQGVMFESVEMVKDLMAKAKTQPGLKVSTAVLNQVHQTGRKVTEEFKRTMEIVFDDYSPQ